jgi:hypothetical protein
MSGGPGVGSSNLPAPTTFSTCTQALLPTYASAAIVEPIGGGELLMSNSGDAVQPVRLKAITRELEAMSDWELERGLASSLGFDDDRRTAASLILRQRYAGTEHASLSGYWR